MNYVSVSSSNIEAVAYEEDTRILGLRFKGGGEYHYFSVPESVYSGLLSASSVGQYFDRHVKKAGYRCQQVR
jgi:hypothetical protein